MEDEEALSLANESDQCKITKLYEALEIYYFSYYRKQRVMQGLSSYYGSNSNLVQNYKEMIDNNFLFFSSYFNEDTSIVGGWAAGYGSKLKIDFRIPRLMLKGNGKINRDQFFWVADNTSFTAPVGGARQEPLGHLKPNSEFKDNSIKDFNQNLTTFKETNANNSIKNLLDYDDQDVINKMHCFYLKNHVLNFFTPELIFMKGYRKVLSDNPKVFTDYEKVVHVEFPLAFHPSDPKDGLSDKTLNNARKRMDQVGVKSFNWSYQGTDTFTAERDITATLVIEAESLDAIFKERKNSDGDKYRISDLIIQADCFEKVKDSTARPGQPSRPKQVLLGPEGRISYNSECYEIIVNCGNNLDLNNYNIARKISKGFASAWEETLEDISSYGTYPFTKIPEDAFKETLFLTVVDHSFDFQEEGNVTLTVEYRARLEAKLRESASDITIQTREELKANNELYTKIAEVLGGETKVNELITKLNTFTENNKINLSATYENLSYWDLLVNKKSGLAIERISDFNYALEAYIRDIKETSETSGGRPAADASEIAKYENVLSIIRRESLYSFLQDVYKHLFSNGLVNAIQASESQNPGLFKYLQNPTKKNLKEAVQEINLISSDPRFEKGTVNLSEQDVFQNDSVGGSILPAPFALGNALMAVLAATYLEVPEGSYSRGIKFVYLGDLIDAILYKLSVLGKMNMRDLFFVLGNVQFPTVDEEYRDDKLIPLSLAALPIEVSTLNSFFTTISDGSKDKYPISAFIRDLVNIVTNSVLDSSCSNLVKFPPSRVKFYNITDVEAGKFYQLTENINIDNFRKLSRSYKSYKDFKTFPAVTDTTAPLPKEKNFMIITSEPKKFNGGSEKCTGDWIQDFKLGIPHFKIGSLDGLFYKARLSKTDQPYLKEARFRDADGNSIMQLSNIYDGFFEMEGNCLLKLGDLFYFDPNTIGPEYLGQPNQIGSLAYYMGLGGLHLVTEIKHSITVTGGHKTTIKARFVSRGELKKQN